MFGNNALTIIRYLEAFSGKNPRTVIVGGGLPDGATEMEKRYILNLVLRRSKNGIATYFVNEHKYNEELQKFEPIVENFEELDFIKNVKKVGAIVKAEATTSMTYINATFGKDEPKIDEGYKGEGILNSHKYAKQLISKQKPSNLGLVYVPSYESFKSGLCAAKNILGSNAPHGKKQSELIISALPGKSIPQTHYNDLLDLKSKYNIDMKVGFKYDGVKYCEEEKEFLEGNKDNPYGASEKVSGLVGRFSENPFFFLQKVNESIKLRWTNLFNNQPLQNINREQAR